MYTPPAFKVDDPAELAAFMSQHPFATIVTHDGAGSHATHMPVLLQPDRGSQGTLVSHLARANPQWTHFENGQEVLVIFTGPHAYVSPSWYTSKPAVPTWNYTAVHAYVFGSIVTDPSRLVEMLGELIEVFESQRENRRAGELPQDFRDRLMQGIVGVEVEIHRLEGKFKLSQNRPDDMPGVIRALAASVDQTDREVAEMMQRLV